MASHPVVVIFLIIMGSSLAALVWKIASDDEYSSRVKRAGEPSVSFSRLLHGVSQMNGQTPCWHGLSALLDSVIRQPPSLPHPTSAGTSPAS